MKPIKGLYTSVSVVGGDGAGEPGVPGELDGTVVNRRPVDTKHQPSWTKE